jgi:histidyl-tRNA synthetase
MGPMFRHERPQKGRYRQFHQFGVETYGMQGPDIDVEVILISARLWKLLGVEEHVTLELNSLGSNDARATYKEKLVAYLLQYKDQLDEDSLRRLETNPLRILDSKNPQVQQVVKDAPKLIDCLDETSIEHFQLLREQLTNLGIQFRVNPNLVRGLDYYNQTVFEWVTTSLGAQGTVCAGGRYDGLVEQIGGKATPAVGFALGLERLILLVETVLEQDHDFNSVDVYIATMGQSAQVYGFKVAEQVRTTIPSLKVMMHHGGGNMKKQMKRADKTGATLALVIGEDEMNNKSVGVKFLRAEQPQQNVQLDDLCGFIREQIL